MVKRDVSEKWMSVSILDGGVPKFEFRGPWGIRDLAHTRTGLFKAYKHYIREIRLKEETK